VCGRRTRLAARWRCRFLADRKGRDVLGAGRGLTEQRVGSGRGEARGNGLPQERPAVGTVQRRRGRGHSGLPTVLRGTLLGAKVVLGGKVPPPKRVERDRRLFVV